MEEMFAWQFHAVVTHDKRIFTDSTFDRFIIHKARRIEFKSFLRFDGGFRGRYWVVGAVSTSQVDQLIQDILHGGIAGNIITEIVAEWTVLPHLELSRKSKTGSAVDDESIDTISTDGRICLVERVKNVDELAQRMRFFQVDSGRSGSWTRISIRTVRGWVFVGSCWISR